MPQKVKQVVAFFELGGPVYSELLRDPFAWQEGRGGWPLHQQAFICPWCTSIWAKTFLDSQGIFAIEPIPCPHCPSTRLTPIPGSLLDIPGTGAIDCVLLDAMPEALLRREFELHLKAVSDVHNG